MWQVGWKDRMRKWEKPSQSQRQLLEPGTLSRWSSYMLLHNTLSRNSGLRQQTRTISQFLRVRNLAGGRFWLRISQEMAFKLMPKPVSSKALKGLEEPPSRGLIDTAMGWSPQLLTGCWLKVSVFFLWVSLHGSHLSALQTRWMSFPEQNEIQG